MYKGTHRRKSGGKGTAVVRSMVMLVSLTLIIMTCVGVTIAYLSTKTENVVNTFEPGEVPPTINETFTGTLKEDVTVTNNGNVSAFIRAAIIVTWQDSEGNVAAVPPVENEDYEISFGSDWTKQEKSDFYYYKAAVAAGGTTTELIEKAYQLKEYSGYQLHIEIVTQTIQSNPASVAEEAWGYVPADA